MILTSTVFLANLPAYPMPRPMRPKPGGKTINKNKRRHSLLHEVFLPPQNEKRTLK